jgi:hypothetical protein
MLQTCCRCCCSPLWVQHTWAGAHTYLLNLSGPANVLGLRIVCNAQPERQSCMVTNNVCFTTAAVEFTRHCKQHPGGAGWRFAMSSLSM